MRNFFKYLLDLGYKVFKAETRVVDNNIRCFYEQIDEEQAFTLPTVYLIKDKYLLNKIKKGEYLTREERSNDKVIYWGKCEGMAVKRFSTLRFPEPNFKVIGKDGYGLMWDDACNHIFNKFSSEEIYNSCFDKTKVLTLTLQ